MAQISAAIITKNEETNIGRCIESLLPVADEIVVVDSNSEDRTAEICRRYPEVRFITREWPGFSQQKQAAAELCRFDYILSLDADEALSGRLTAEIKRVKPELDGATAYEFDRLTNYCGQWIYHSGWRPDRQLRLYPKAGCRWNGALVHERVRCNETVSIRRLPGDLLHYSYKSISDHLERANRYTDLGALAAVEKGERFLRLKSLVNPVHRFLKTYFVKLGFLDGYYGLCISLISSFIVHTKYSKAYRLKSGKKDRAVERAARDR